MKKESKKIHKKTGWELDPKTGLPKITAKNLNLMIEEQMKYPCR